MLNGWKTLIGLAIAAVPTVASFFGYEVSPDFLKQATEHADAIIVIVGLTIALVGRLVATVPGWFAKR